MSCNNTNVLGTGRQSHRTSDGLYLERKYIYLTPDLWSALSLLSSQSGLSASQYLASILAANGPSTQGITYDPACPSR